MALLLARRRNDRGAEEGAVMDLGTEGGGTYRETRARRAPLAGGDGPPEPLDHAWLLPFLLLCLQEQDLRGYELMYRIGNLGFGGVRPGEVYKLLREAEDEDLVFSEREEAECMFSRRSYGLAEPGEAYLEFLRNALESYRREIKVFLRVYDARQPREAHA